MLGDLELYYFYNALSKNKGLLFEAPGSALSLVGLFKHAQRLNPGLFANSESFLLTLSNGKVLHRDVMAKNPSAAKMLGSSFSLMASLAFYLRYE